MSGRTVLRTAHHGGCTGISPLRTERINPVMTTEATFRVPSDQFPLGRIFEQLQDVSVKLERIIPARDVVIPYFWVQGIDVDDIEGNLPTIRM